MNIPVRPELPTAALRSSQATHAAVDNSAPLPNHPESTYKSGKAVQTNGATSERLQRSFKAANLNCSSFVKFIPWQEKAEFYSLLRQADVFLDTIGFSGFNTAMQAVECGLPVVTREGRFMRGKFASAILRRMDLSEVIADSDQSYVETAVRLSRDKAFNERVREKLLTARHILFCDEAPIKALEDLIVRLMRGDVGHSI